MYSTSFKMTGLGLVISLVLLGQTAIANTEAPTNSNPSQDSSSVQPKQKNAVAEAVNSVYRIWLAIPFSSTMIYELEMEGFLPLGSQDVIDKQGYLREFTASGQEIVFFKYKDKIYLVQGHGTGYAVTDDGVLITNNHVVNINIDELYELKMGMGSYMQGDPEVFVTTSIVPDFKVYKAEIIESKKDKDLAIIKAQGLPAKALKLAKVEYVAQADNVHAIGFPATSDELVGGLDDPASFTTPSVDNGSLKRQVTINDVGLWEHGVNITNGNSGGPLINQCAEVVATNVMGLQTGEGVTLTAGAISLDELLPLLTKNNINFVQASGVCDPYATATSTDNKALPASQTPQSSDKLEMQTSQKTPDASKILGLESSIFWVIIAGLVFGLLAVILFLVTRKKDVPPPTASTNHTPVSPPPTQKEQVQPTLKTTVSTVSDNKVGVKTQIDASKTVHLQGEYPITLREHAPFVIGRDPNCDLVIANGKISSRHVQLIYQNGQIIVIDLQSTNGTFVNGQRMLGESRLQVGDSLSLTKENIASWQYGAGGQAQRAIGTLTSEGIHVPAITLYTGKSFTLGRGNGNDVIINNPTVSSSHCTIMVDYHGNVEIIDNNSTNGTFIGQMNNRITRANLNEQQVLYIGSQDVRFRLKKF